MQYHQNSRIRNGKTHGKFLRKLTMNCKNSNFPRFSSNDSLTYIITDRFLVLEKQGQEKYVMQAFFLYTLEKTQGPKKTQGSRKNSGFCQFSSKLRSKTAIFGSLYLIRLQKNSGSSQKNSGFWMSCSSIDIHQGVQKKSLA